MTRTHSRASLKNANGNVKEDFRGTSAIEMHQKHAFPVGAKCGFCSSRPLMRAIVYLELKEAIRMNPQLQLVAAIAPQEFMLQVVKMKGGDGRPQNYFRASVAYACKAHTPEMEKFLAKNTPSHAIVDINHGPKERRIIASG